MGFSAQVFGRLASVAIRSAFEEFFMATLTITTQPCSTELQSATGAIRPLVSVDPLAASVMSAIASTAHRQFTAVITHRVMAVIGLPPSQYGCGRACSEATIPSHAHLDCNAQDLVSPISTLHSRT
jgi:hypothetical protein